MPPCHSQQPAAERGVRHVDLDARLTAALTAVVAGARRRALRDGDRQIDTAHLLHTLLESDPEVRAVFDGPQVARLLGYLVQRAIGYGLRWQSSVEDSGALPVLCEPEGWSPTAAIALEAACVRAERGGHPRTRGLDLLATIVTDPESRAVEVLVRAGVDVEALPARIEAAAVVEEYEQECTAYEQERAAPEGPTAAPGPVRQVRRSIL
ncbi:Clp protease N-terminal domain-containing protein [Streptomyces macrolidinus]|uniref:Clp protease N-terminal domain-containing protein n=1 Tax=Streptomyces macrolidinus TaxID=2952607 RepID=UPI0027E2D3DF|nr:Clp protease N-terminal domain-containing protein [Streptomyces macrolidinus]